MKAQPWSSRLAACAWLDTQAKVDAGSMQRATAAARLAAGPDMRALREQKRREIFAETDRAQKDLHDAIKRLKRLEKEAIRHIGQPQSLDEAIAGLPGGEHWRHLPELERAASSFSRSIQPLPPAAPRARGERASADAASANSRYVKAFFEEISGREATPKDLAIVEIGAGYAAPCADVDDFAARTKRWSKALRPK